MKPKEPLLEGSVYFLGASSCGSLTKAMSHTRTILKPRNVWFSVVTLSNMYMQKQLTVLSKKVSNKIAYMKAPNSGQYKTDPQLKLVPSTLCSKLFVQKQITELDGATLSYIAGHIDEKCSFSQTLPDWVSVSDPTIANNNRDTTSHISEIRSLLLRIMLFPPSIRSMSSGQEGIFKASLPNKRVQHKSAKPPNYHHCNLGYNLHSSISIITEGSYAALRVKSLTLHTR